MLLWFLILVAFYRPKKKKKKKKGKKKTKWSPRFLRAMNRRRLEAEKKRPKKKRKRRRRRRRRSRKGTKRKQKKKPTSGERCKRSHYLVVIKQTTHRLNDNIMKIMAPSTSSGRFYGLLATSKIHNTKKTKTKTKTNRTTEAFSNPFPKFPRNVSDLVWVWTVASMG